MPAVCSFLPRGTGVRMDLKLSEGIIRTTQYKFMLKNPKNLEFDFH